MSHTECATREKIKNTVSAVRKVSFEEKINFSEEKLNNYLDAILDFKNMLTEKTGKINDLTEKLESVTWLQIKDEENLMLLNDLIALAKDLHSSLIRNYVIFNPLRQKGIANDRIKKYKTAVDDFRESFLDIESAFFFLPEMPEFKETTKELSLI